MTPHRLPEAPDWARDLFTVGVTGTNGKTTTTTYVAAALAAGGAPAVGITSLSTFVDLGGGALERLATSGDYDGFLEAMRVGRARGATRAAIELTSEALAAGFARAWPCSVGVLTSFDRDHQDAHGSAEHYLASKAQLFVRLPRGGTAILNAGCTASELVTEVVPEHARLWRYGLLAKPGLELYATAIEPSWDGTRIMLDGVLPDLPAELSIRAIGDVFAENALAALAAAAASGVPLAGAARAIARSEPLPGRFECVARRPWVVVDHAHTPAAIARTLATARRMCSGRVTLVFGAGGGRDRGKRRLMGAAAARADRVIVTNDNPRDEAPLAIAEEVASGVGAHGGLEVELDRAVAIGRAIRHAAADDVVVVAGRGAETLQVIGRERVALSDAEAARRAHAALSR